VLVYYNRAKLRQVMYQCLHQANHVLRAESGLIGQLVPVVIESLVSVVYFVLTHI